MGNLGQDQQQEADVISMKKILLLSVLSVFSAFLLSCTKAEKEYPIEFYYKIRGGFDITCPHNLSSEQSAKISKLFDNISTILNEYFEQQGYYDARKDIYVSCFENEFDSNIAKYDKAIMETLERRMTPIKTFCRESIEPLLQDKEAIGHVEFTITVSLAAFRFEAGYSRYTYTGNTQINEYIYKQRVSVGGTEINKVIGDDSFEIKYSN